jgi:hypothetical protein
MLIQNTTPKVINPRGAGQTMKPLRGIPFPKYFPTVGRILTRQPYTQMKVASSISTGILQRKPAIEAI